MIRPAAALGLCVALGCSASDVGLPSDVILSSDHVRYHARGTRIDLCRGVVADLEDHANGVLSLFGLSWEPGRTIDYYLFDNATDLGRTSLCGGHDGCYDGRSDSIYSVSAFHAHELVHALLRSVGTPPAIYREGIAEAIGCNYFRTLRTSDAVRNARWQELIALGNNIPNGSEGTFYYDVARQFVRHIVEQFGLPAFVNFYSFAQATDPVGFELDFQTAFNANLDDVWNRAMQQAYPEGIGICPCRGEAVPSDSGPHTGGNAAGCGYNPRLFEVSTSGPVTIDVNEGSPVVMSCGGNRTPAVALQNNTGDTPPLLGTYLAAGRYFMTQLRPASLISITSSGPHWLGQDCNTLVPLEIQQADTRPLLVAFPDETWIAALRMPRRYNAVTSILTRGAAMDQGYLCRSCDELRNNRDACHRFVSDGTKTTTELNGDYIIGFFPPAPDASYVPVAIVP